MSTFRCKHCGRRVKKNPRIKGDQQYCGSPDCQQSRKNKWEREKIRKDGLYRQKREESKRRWRKRHRGYEYQCKYRASHPEYVKANREKQGKRNQNHKSFLSGNQIVKTDALNYAGLIRRGLYALQPVITDASGKIVKTDALIVQLSEVQLNTVYHLQNSP